MAIRYAAFPPPPQPATRANTTANATARTALPCIAHRPHRTFTDRNRARAHAHDDRRGDAVGRGIDPREGVVDGSCDPDAAGAEGDSGGTSADGNSGHDPVRG